MKKLFTILLLVTCQMLLVSKADASAFSVELYPPIIQIKAVPPVTLQTPIIVKNQGDQSETLDISFKQFAQSDEQNGQVRYLKDEELNLKDPLMMQRISIYEEDTEISKIELGPKQQKELKLRVEVPENETASDYYFSVIFTSTSQQNQGQKNKSDILTAVATNVLLSVGQEEQPKIQLEQLHAPFFQKEGPVEFKIRVSNTGDHFASVKGEVTISNMFGQKIGRVDIPPTNVLAGTKRTINSTWSDKFILGPYTATLTLSVSDKGPVLKKATHFTGAPVQIFIFTFVILGLFLVIKSRVKRKLKKS